MAKQLIQKNIRRNDTLAQGVLSFHVTGGDTLTGPDFQFLAEDGVTILTFIPRKIDLVINAESGVVVIDGKNFASGTWTYHLTGGIPCGASIVVGAGNVTIQLRS
jgi:hypothetical protein